MNEIDEHDTDETKEFTTSERRLWLFKFIVRHPIFSFKEFWNGLDDEDIKVDKNDFS